MLDKLKQLDNRYSELGQRMENGEIYADPAAYTKCAREMKELEPIVTAYREYVKCEKTMHDAEELMSDPEFKELAQEEYNDAKQRIGELGEQLKILLLPKDPNDERNVIMEIRSGVGGEESSLFAHDLFRMYSMYAESKGWKIDIVNINETELGGIKEMSFVVEGQGAYSRLKFEAGGHRVQRVPETESGGRIHTSTATVAVLPEAEDVDIEINPADLQIDTFRSGGAGGQHINKTESAIRITHLPTGIVAECQDERSQHKNREKAMRVLRSRILEAERKKQQSSIADERKSQVGTGDRSERIRTYNYPQGRVSDHRIGLTIYKLEQFLNGDMDEVIDALITADTAKKLSQQDDI